MRHPYADFIDRVEKPGRYLGGEYQQVVKDPAAVNVSIVLAFPDVYDIGMSHLGTKILYSILNQDPRIACERAFAPWPDMEAELRKRSLPLVSLETARPLQAFDVIGMSLQYELTYTNCLLVLELSGLPLRAADRTDDMPLVIAGGPTATHPEPMAAFFDAFFVGEGEEVLPDLILFYKALRTRGFSKRDALIRCAARGALYVPSLYETAVCGESKLEYVARPTETGVPARVTRAWVKDLAKYPFPDDSPVPFTEAIFDRAAVEIARGCTEGCRFCQAGMIYRPVRERSPDQIIDAVLGGVRKGGYDETAITSLSTADYSCVTPLVTNLMKKLREEKVSLAVSSLRAYGLNEELLDEMATVRATGLTFAPEAGTQRMRDVINKNITEQHVTDSAERVFGRGWNRMKLYFMIGLPTERDEDVEGIVEFGHRVRKIGRKQSKDAAVTVSVSSHVPKPHTPFQWCAQDPPAEIERKQSILRRIAAATKTELKTHDVGMSHVEGWHSRGDRRMSDVIEHAYRDGARFDSWDEWFSLERWERAAAACGVDTSIYQGTIPVTAHLPWDHIDVGLEDGFLLKEYRKALKDRLSPPCGKVVDKLLHATNVQDAQAEKKKLVCYECGVACDMDLMREERIVFLRRMGAEQPRVVPPDLEGAGIKLPAPSKLGGKKPAPRAWLDGDAQGQVTRIRLRFHKLGRAAFMSHLDLTRLLLRIVRRAGLTAIYSQGFHPKPIVAFSPALALGIQSLGEYCDVSLGGVPEGIDPGGSAGSAGRGVVDPLNEMCRRLTAVAPDGLIFGGARVLAAKDAPLGKTIGQSRFAAQLLGLSAAEAEAGLAAFAGLTGPLPFTRYSADGAKRKAPRSFDLRDYLLGIGAFAPEQDPAAAGFLAALGQFDGWLPEEGAIIEFRIRQTDDGSAKPSEIVQQVFGKDQLGRGVRYARLSLTGQDGATDPLDLEAIRAQVVPLPAGAPAAAEAEVIQL